MYVRVKRKQRNKSTATASSSNPITTTASRNTVKLYQRRHNFISTPTTRTHTYISLEQMREEQTGDKHSKKPGEVGRTWGAILDLLETLIAGVQGEKDGRTG